MFWAFLIFMLSITVFFFPEFDLNLQVELASLQQHVLVNTLFTTEVEKVSGAAVMG